MKNSTACHFELRKERGNLAFVLWFLLYLFFASLAFADPSSTNYQIAQSYLPGAAGNPASTNYKSDESTVDYYDKSTASSTNYTMQQQVGISGLDKIPVLNSITPSDYARFFSDENASYAVSATATDGDTLEYRAKQDGTTKAGPQASSTLSWALSSADLGRHVHSLETIDPDGTVIKQQSSYIYRRPVK